eukprot:scaffold14744_cov91-Isochrysis_galbana.AAC.1
MPATGAPRIEVQASRPTTSELDTMRGSTDTGTPSASHVGACHSHASKSISMVREALVTSGAVFLDSLGHGGLVADEPGQFDRAEIGGDGEASHATEALLCQLGGSQVQPYHRVVQGLAGVLVPDDGRLALVGDPDRNHVQGRIALVGQLGHGGVDALDRVVENLERVVLAPPVPRVELLVLHLVRRNGARMLVEQDEARRGGALVERPHQLLGSQTARETQNALPSAGLQARAGP